jgi:hypothetical protein
MHAKTTLHNISYFQCTKVEHPYSDPEFEGFHTFNNECQDSTTIYSTARPSQNMLYF